MPRKSLKSRIKKIVPRPVMNLRIRARAVKTMMRGGVYECNICRYQGRFLPYGVNFPIRDAYCPRCGCVERHRLAALLIEQHPQLLDGLMLHFAPEPALANLFKHRVTDY